MKYTKGNHVKMTSEALDNYGPQWADVELIVTHSADKYMQSTLFYKKGTPNGYHPGYDEGVKPQGLYDLKRADNGEPLGMSLYDWELVST